MGCRVRRASCSPSQAGARRGVGWTPSGYSCAPRRALRTCAFMTRATATPAWRCRAARRSARWAGLLGHGQCGDHAEIRASVRHGGPGDGRGAGAAALGGAVMTGKARKVRLTDAAVRKLPPGNTEYIVRDNRIAGLGVRVRPSGHRSFVWHGTANGRMVRTTIRSGRADDGEASPGRMPVPARRLASALLRRPCRPGCRSPFPGFRHGGLVAGAPGPLQRRLGQRVDRMIRARLLPAFGALRLDRIGRPHVERWFDNMSRKTPGAATSRLPCCARSWAPRKPPAMSGPIRLQASGRTGQEDDPVPVRRRDSPAHRTLDRLVEERPSRRPQADIIRLLC